MTQDLFFFSSLYGCYLKCRRRKRNTANALRFELALEENLCRLERELHRSVLGANVARGYSVYVVGETDIVFDHKLKTRALVKIYPAGALEVCYEAPVV